MERKELGVSIDLEGLAIRNIPPDQYLEMCGFDLSKPIKASQNPEVEYMTVFIQGKK